MLRLRALRKERGISQTILAQKFGITQATLSGWENEKYEIDNANIIKLADYFDCSVDYLLGITNSRVNDKLLDDMSEIDDDIREKYGNTHDAKKAQRIRDHKSVSTVPIPIVGEIAAGYEKEAFEDLTNGSIDIPVKYLNGRSEKDFFILKVVGDSMYPMYHDGDHVLILKQSALNYSGSIGAVIYDDNIATLKKVEYAPGEDWMRLVPINPAHAPKRIEGPDLEKCRILGIPKLLIREINE